MVIYKTLFKCFAASALASILIIFPFAIVVQPALIKVSMIYLFVCYLIIFFAENIIFERLVQHKLPPLRIVKAICISAMYLISFLVIINIYMVYIGLNIPLTATIITIIVSIPVGMVSERIINKPRKLVIIQKEIST
jgi:peptidoglycan/LPS O-acetylase OafA/YrhL